MPSRKSLLTIAGFDPTGGAGLLTDTAVFRALGFHPLAVLTSVAAQGAGGVARVIPLPADFIARELEIVFSEFSPAAIKIGMLYSEAAVAVVARFLQEKKIPAVLDPILQASSGGVLLQPEAIPALESQLIPLCWLVTPNLPEASYFLRRPVTTLAEAKIAAQDLAQRWGTAVLLKGGHLLDESTDVLAEGRAIETFPHPRRAEGILVRGTGCALSSAWAAGWAHTTNLREAVVFALDFVQLALQGHYTCDPEPKVGFLNLSSKPL